MKQSIHCPTNRSTWLSWRRGLLGAPAAHSTVLSCFPGRAATLTVPTLPSELELGRHCHSTNLRLTQQTSTDSDICKDNHRNYFIYTCTFLFQYWVKERDKYLGLACRYFPKTVIAV